MCYWPISAVEAVTDSRAPLPLDDAAQTFNNNNTRLNHS